MHALKALWVSGQVIRGEVVIPPSPLDGPREDGEGGERAGGEGGGGKGDEEAVRRHGDAEKLEVVKEMEVMMEVVMMARPMRVRDVRPTRADKRKETDCDSLAI